MFICNDAGDIGIRILSLLHFSHRQMYNKFVELPHRLGKD